ncbi:tetratricopeptide repeat protein [Myxococcaceae bacterium GXIMD 01537]
MTPPEGPSRPDAEPVRWWRGPGMGLLFVVCGVAFVVHLIPLFLPRNEAEQELELARANPVPANRVQRLRPLQEHPKATPAHLREAAELLLEGAPSEAHELAEEALRREPASVESLLVLARVCEVERRERCVRESLERADQVAPGDPRPELLRADMRERVGDLGGAVEAVERARHHVPEDVAVAVRYSRLLREVGRYTDAEAVLEALSGRLPEPKRLAELGLARVKAGRDEEARALFQRAVEEDPRFAQGYYYLGLAEYRLGHEDAAREALREANRRDLTDWRPLAALCSVQQRTGQKEAARATRMDLERRFAERMDSIRETCPSE